MSIMHCDDIKITTLECPDSLPKRPMLEATPLVSTVSMIECVEFDVSLETLKCVISGKKQTYNTKINTRKKPKDKR